MKRAGLSVIVVLMTVIGSAVRPASACTNFLITKGASADGSVMITYAADAHDFYGELSYIPPGVHPPGAMRDVFEWDTGEFLGRIAEVPVTYSVVGNMNEHQVAIGETTFGDRKELVGSGLVDYGSLMFIALQRATTAREAIQVIGDIVEQYGYASDGESLSISDPNEAWIFEIMGKGADDPGAVWVARRVPDGYISAHANQARIRTFPQDDPENCLFADDVISFARERGYYSGPDADFSFVAQSRSSLPDPVGGVFWFGVDDTASTVYFPVYYANREVPPSFAAGNGSLTDFTWDSAFWVFNWVANFSYLRYNLMIEDVHKVQRELEGQFLAEQPEVEKAALALHERSPRLAVDYLTDHSVRMGEMVTARWRKLGEFLLVKYLDGNVKTPGREVEHPGYDDSWYRHVAEQEGDRLKVRPLPGEVNEGH